MSSKKYTLVAWTEKGEVRMIPSLINDVAEPYRRRIAYLESISGDVEDEVGWLIAQSRAHEAFARFLLRVGHPRAAYVEFGNAAIVCSNYWLHDEQREYPKHPLFSRFLAMHGECVGLTQKDRILALTYEGSELQGHYCHFTRESIE